MKNKENKFIERKIAEIIGLKADAISHIVTGSLITILLTCVLALPGVLFGKYNKEAMYIFGLLSAMAPVVGMSYIAEQVAYVKLLSKQEKHMDLMNEKGVTKSKKT